MPTKTVLIVDSHEDSREIFAAILQFGGFSVLQVRDSAEACKLVGQQGISAVITELMLPIVSGVDLLRRLKATPATSDLPVIVVTTDARPEAREQAIGCDAFLIKPCAPEDLLHAVQNVLSQRQELALHNG